MFPTGTYIPDSRFMACAHGAVHFHAVHEDAGVPETITP
jgi:hypothetical protein